MLYNELMIIFLRYEKYIKYLESDSQATLKIIMVLAAKTNLVALDLTTKKSKSCWI
jgi:hypothetical protein